MVSKSVADDALKSVLLFSEKVRFGSFVNRLLGRQINKSTFNISSELSASPDDSPEIVSLESLKNTNENQNVVYCSCD